MTGSAKDTSGSPNDPFGMLAWLNGTAGLSMHPMMAQTTGTAVAATAIGMSVSSQLAGSFFGALQGATETMRKGHAGETVVDPPQQPAVPVVVEEDVDEEIVETVAEAVAVDVVATPVEETKLKASAKAAVRAKPSAKTRSAVVAAPVADANDLKRIGSIGPKLEQVLHGMGIASLADIAGWDEAKAAEVDQALGFDGRILKDDWIGQAKALTGA